MSPAQEMVTEAMILISRAAADLRRLSPSKPPPEYYDANRVWLLLEEVSKRLALRDAAVGGVGKGKAHNPNLGPGADGREEP